MDKTRPSLFSFFAKHDISNLLYPQTRPQPPLVKPDDDFFAGVNDWYAHLAGFVYHLLALLQIRSHVVLRITDAVCSEEFLGHVAVNAGGGRINSYVAHVMYE